MEKLFVVLVASSVFGASILSAPLDGDCVRAFKRESGPSLRDGACFELLADVVVARNARMRACETIRRDGLCALLQNASLCEKLSGKRSPPLSAPISFVERFENRVLFQLRRNNDPIQPENRRCCDVFSFCIFGRRWWWRDIRCRRRRIPNGMPRVVSSRSISSVPRRRCEYVKFRSPLYKLYACLCATEPASAVSASRKPHYVTLQNPAPGTSLLSRTR